MFVGFRKILGGKVKLLVAGGAPMNQDTQRSIKMCFACPFLQGYGATETGGCGAINLSNHLELF